MVLDCLHRADCVLLHQNQCPGERECKKCRRTKRYFEQSNLDRPFWNFNAVKTWTNKDEAAYRELSEIGKDIWNFVVRGEQLIIHSPHTGNGKTTWAIRLLRNYLYAALPDKGRSNAGLYVTMFEFLDRQRESMSGFNEIDFIDLKNKMLKMDLLVIDDLGTMAMSEFAAASLLNIIDTRLNRGLSTIYTTNLNPNSKEFINIFGVRLASRLRMARTIKFEDGDKRVKYGTTTTAL